MRTESTLGLPLRISVRGLVAFSVCPPDILPVSMAAMELGRQGHLGRQQQSAGAAEQHLAWEGTVEGRDVLVSGRMDLFEPDSSPPLIEEIKLTPQKLPEQPLQEHLLQAVCYGFMLSQQQSLPALQLRVSYVTPEGQVTAQFTQPWTQEDLHQAFFDLLVPYVAWQNQLQSHIKKRNLSLEALPFPYASYRPGQREMAAQVYTAIRERRRLFAQMPTGTGKSAAVLYPALKALGLGLSLQVYCLTARGTQRQAMIKELARMRSDGLILHALTLNAKEKVCPMDQLRCHPDHCDRAKGHYLRQPKALSEALGHADWDEQVVQTLADRHQLCPFELSLALCELADVVVCDYNYALDPQVRLSRIFDAASRQTLLVDEAHNLADRARDMLSGRLSHHQLSEFRREAGKLHGRTSPVYKAATALLRLLEKEQVQEDISPLQQAVTALLAASSAAFTPGGMVLARELIKLNSALYRAQESPEDYALLHQPGKSAALQALNLNPAPHLQEVTRRLAGCIFYSATLSPLSALRSLLGGQVEDACLALPSPFPVEHLYCLQLDLNTRFKAREASLQPAAQAILALFSAHPCKMMAYFPSFAYLHRVQAVLESLAPDLPLLIQQTGMEIQAREQFLAAFTKDGLPLLGLCVLGGIFAEGVDLPGTALQAVAILGVGLPQVNPEREQFRQRMEETMGDGFAFAYTYPGMHKVLQAAGRLIRSEQDRGLLLLLDDRYRQNEYQELLPPHIQPERVYSTMEITQKTQAFWQEAGEGGRQDG